MCSSHEGCLVWWSGAGVRCACRRVTLKLMALPVVRQQRQLERLENQRLASK